MTKRFLTNFELSKQDLPSLLSGSLEVDENHTSPHSGFPCDVHPDHLHTDGQEAFFKSQAMSLLFLKCWPNVAIVFSSWPKQESSESRVSITGNLCI